MISSLLANEWDSAISLQTICVVRMDDVDMGDETKLTAQGEANPVLSRSSGKSLPTTATLRPFKVSSLAIESPRTIHIHVHLALSGSGQADLCMA